MCSYVEGHSVSSFFSEEQPGFCMLPSATPTNKLQVGPLGMAPLLCIMWQWPEDWIQNCCSNCNVRWKTLQRTSLHCATLQQMLWLWWVNMNKTRLHVTYWKMSGFFQLGPKLHEQLEMPSASQSLFLDECAAYLSLNKNATGRIYTKCYLFTCSDLRSCRSRRGVSLSVRACHLG